jgi:hypothetical protein
MVENKKISNRVPFQTYMTVENFERLEEIRHHVSRSTFINDLVEREWSRRNN